MNPQSNTPPTQTIVVLIENVDMTNRLVHAFDKSKARIDISFRDVPGGGLLRIPTQGERWVATRTGWIWRLIARLDSSTEQDELVATLQPGDARLAADGTLYINVDDIVLNGRKIGTTVRDSFYQSTAYTSVTLAEVPVTVQSVMPFLNGLLVSPDQWSLNNATLTFNTSVGLGSLVVYYQAIAHAYDDVGTVVGKAVIPTVTTGGGYGSEIYGSDTYGP